MGRLPGLVANDARGARNPENAAVFADITLFHRTALGPAQHLFHQPLRLRDVVGMGNIDRCPAQQLVFGIADHAGEARVDLLELFVQSYDRHADGSLVKKLPRVLIAGLQSRRSVGDETHFVDAAEARNNQKNIFKDHPTCMFHGSPWAGTEHPVDRVRPIDASEEVVERDYDRGWNQNPPISIKRQDNERAEDVKMGFDAAAGHPDEKGGHEHLGHGHHVPGHDGARPHSCHPYRKKTDRAAHEDGGPDMNVDLTCYAVPRAG
jgi:hypothetical protein